MLKIHELREIIRLIDQSSIQEFELENEGSKVTIRKPGHSTVQVVEQPASVQVVQTAPAAPITEQPVVQEKKEEVAPQPVVTAQVQAQEEEQLHKIVSPMVGTFYSKPEPGAPTYVQPGDKINANTIVCIVEAMKLFNEIEAEVSGEIVKVLVQDGQLVEYGQPLFLVKP
ncbi:acetyl-CoA carboxylase biotin carboxyl carrier protein [Ammoniphilus resinae]|uniref:Biotin carboxyl carrier protein of acetyl-CoA carboxylase n=1 Tax=Ammoniphilus resinae TaxID=861532 RepID=A0ABS4GV98_9BACL|nr:acetyl-CoA carboxylase biotin carboxyl carrier protein [Ammoniphilus resinae]MBP1934181.1 acetyl-CoA carboxylase biotin carboxyl carrier protein [Ammoniphilus resinae]